LYNNDANVQAVAQKLAEKYGEPYGPTRCFWSERYNWDNWDDNDGAMLIWSWHVPNEVTYDIDGNPIYSIYPPGTKAGIIWVRSDYYGWSAAEALMLSSENEIWLDEVSKVEQPDMPGIEMPKTRLARALLKPPSPLQNAMLHTKSAPTVQNAVLRTKVSGARFQPAAARPMIQLSGVGNSTWMKFWVFDWLPFKAWAWLGYGWTRYEVQYIIPQSIKFNPAGFYSCMAVGNNIGTLGIGGCPTAALLSLILPIPGPQAAVFGACTVAGVMCAIGNLNVKFK
jgi:hypothetical protein